MNKEPEPNPGEVILIDKPYDWTSFDVIKKLRSCVRFKKIGHAGTLDPLATGLLIICTGSKTKEIEDYQDLEKEYTGSLILGQTTASIDLETPVLEKRTLDRIAPQDIHDSAEKFVGKLKQIPPQHSAVKVGGERVYHKARQGEKVKPRPRLVEIRQFEVTKIDLPRVEFKVCCSKGTYIRSLVRDLGEDLGVGAVLSSLRRTRIGDYTVEQASSLSDYLTSHGREAIKSEASPRYLRTKPLQ